jgi:hypothetical protein
LVTFGFVMVLGFGFSTLPFGHTNGPLLVALVLALAQVNTTCSNTEQAQLTRRHTKGLLLVATQPMQGEAAAAGNRMLGIGPIALAVAA